MRAFGEYTGEISFTLKKKNQAYSKEEMGALNLLLYFLICTLILTSLHALVCLHFNQGV